MRKVICRKLHFKVKKEFQCYSIWHKCGEMPTKNSRTTPPEGEKKVSMHTLKLDDAQMAKIRAYCDHQLWEFFQPDHSLYGFRHKIKGVTLVAYKSGKLVISGKGTAAFVQEYIEPEITGEARLGYDDVHHPEWFTPHAGMDEAGKGDLFGPLVAATVIADEAAVRTWLKAGVRDSKATSDGAIFKLEKIIRATPGVVVQTAFAGMARYNELMARPKANLNTYLAWLHARALQNAYARKPVPWGLLDQFTKQPLVPRQLRKDGFTNDFDLRERTRAESDPVVAAASIIARSEFLRQLEQLAEPLGEPLCKGSGAPAKQQAIRIVRTHGDAALATYAKMHFKTAYEARGLKPPEKPAFRKTK